MPLLWAPEPRTTKPRGLHHTQWAGPPSHINHSLADFTAGIPTGQSAGAIFSIAVPPSRMTLACEGDIKPPGAGEVVAPPAFLAVWENPAPARSLSPAKAAFSALPGVAARSVSCPETGARRERGRWWGEKPHAAACFLSPREQVLSIPHGALWPGSILGSGRAAKGSTQPGSP